MSIGNTNATLEEIQLRVKKRYEHVFQIHSVAQTLLNDAKLRDHWEGYSAAMNGQKIKYLEGFTSETGGLGGELRFLQELMEMLGVENNGLG